MNGLFQSKLKAIERGKAAKFLSFMFVGLGLVFITQKITLARSALDPLEDTFETLGDSLGYGANGVDAVNIVNILEVGYGILLFIVWLKLAVNPLLQGDLTAPFVAMITVFFLFMSGSWMIGTLLPKEAQNVSYACKHTPLKHTDFCNNVNQAPEGTERKPWWMPI